MRYTTDQLYKLTPAKLGYVLLDPRILRNSQDVQRILGLNPLIVKDELGRTPLHNAIYHSFHKSARILMGYVDVNIGDQYGETALHIAVRREHGETVRALLDHGADVNLESEEHWTPLQKAMYHQNLGIVKMLVGAGANMDIVSTHHVVFTPLIYSIKHKLFRFAEFLIASGADVNLGFPFVDGTNHTPLLELFEGLTIHLGILGALLDHKADVSVRGSNGDTLLHKALMQHSPVAIRMLLEHGGDPNAVNAFMETPLHAAAYYNRQAAIKLLLDAGGDPRMVDKYGKKPEYHTNVQRIKALLNAKEESLA